LFQQYFKGLYQRTMREAYATATKEIIDSLLDGGTVLHCGSNNSSIFDVLAKEASLTPKRYYGIEWDRETAKRAQDRGLQVISADLNKGIPHADNMFKCVFGLSVLEHLLYGCKFLEECHRVLQENGKLVLLTPNISTYFTAALILAGKMPSSGPHPDSNILLKSEELVKVSKDRPYQGEDDWPMYRHLVVFSYRVLRDYLKILGFNDVRGYGYGLYPLPNFIQPLVERIDPYHCHQMVFIARK
jgi:SAM-dependent methyltransferase